MKKLIFLGGESGVGKSTIANALQKEKKDICVVDKDESTSIFTHYILKENGKKPHDRESEFYLNNIKPLEYEQLDKIVEYSLRNKSVVATAPYFDNFLNEDWISDMEYLAKYNDSEVYFFYIVRNPDEVLQGLKDRNAIRDTWKINNYLKYRENIDNLNSKILSKKYIKKIDINIAFDYKKVFDVFS